jgi:hypothetical protein
MWRAVFWWKKRTGWLDLGQRIEVTGTVVGLEAPDLDGDRNLNLRLDPGQDRWITGFGARLTSEDQAVGPSLHCEVTPWSSQQLRDSFDALHVGDRVRIGGAWGFDGVHIGYSFFPFEVLRALVRHQPNVCDGWFEIHPVDLLNKL